MKFLLIIAVFLLLSSAVYGVSITDLTVSDDVWLNDNNTLAISLLCDRTAVVSATVSGNGYSLVIGTFDEDEVNETVSQYSTTAPLIGIQEHPNPYTVTVRCTSVETVEQSTTFFVKKASLQIVRVDTPPGNPPAVFYPGDTITLLADLRVNGAPISDSSFTVFATSQLDVMNAVLDASGLWIVTARVPSTVQQAEDTPLKLTAYHNSRTTEATYGAFDIGSFVVVTIIEPSLIFPVRVNTTSQQLTAVVKILYRDRTTEPFDVDQFVVTIDNMTADIHGADFRGAGEWALTIGLPRLEPSNRTRQLHVSATVRGITGRTTKPLVLEVLVPIEGKITDADGEAVPLTMTIYRSGFTRQISTDSGGYYSTELLPGLYNIDIGLPLVDLRLRDVFVTYSSGLYRDKLMNIMHYDAFNNDDTGNRIGAFGIVAIDFALSFNNATLFIPYNEQLVSNENEIEVYRCDQWKFEERTCRVEWTPVDAAIDTTNNVVRFTTTSLSAFALVEPNALSLDVAGGMYIRGEPVSLPVTVRDSKGNSVTKVLVSYTSSFASGSFMNDEAPAIVFTPTSEGAYKMSITAHKSGYTDADTTIDIDVRKRTSLALTLPEITLAKGTTYEGTIQITNNGEADLSNIRLLVEGIPSLWYKLDTYDIATLAIGQTMPVNITITVPFVCDDCQPRYVITVRADHDGATTTATTTAAFAGDDQPHSITAQVTTETASNYPLIVAALVVIVIAVLFSRKRSKPPSRLIDNVKQETVGGRARQEDMKERLDRLFKKR